MKNIYKVFLLIFISIFLISCKDNGKRAFENDYQMFKGEEHVFRKVDYDTMYQEFTKSTEHRVIVFAFDPDLYECPYCMLLLPIMNEVALEEGLKEILYFDVYEMRKDRTNEYVDLVEFITSQTDLEIRNDLHEIVVPDIYLVKNGKIISHHIATFKDEEGRFIFNLTEAEKEEIKSIYRDMFKKVN